MSLRNVLIVDPSRLFRDGLKEILQRSGFASSRESASLGEGLANQVDDIDAVIWTLDCSTADIADDDLDHLRRCRAMRPPMRFIALTDSVSRAGVAKAMAAGVDAFLSKDISGDVFVRSLDLVLLGQQLFPPELAKLLAAGTLADPHDRPAPAARLAERSSPVLGNAATAANEPVAETPDTAAAPAAPAAIAPAAITFDDAGETSSTGESLPAVASLRQRHRGVSLSERESDILRYLVEGSSNKVIARELAISEATVKVHVKGLLRKVRVTNRTQAAVWALSYNEGNAPIAKAS